MERPAGSARALEELEDPQGVEGHETSDWTRRVHRLGYLAVGSQQEPGRGQKPSLALDERSRELMDLFGASAV